MSREKDRSKQIQDKCQMLLTQMLRDDDNKYCVDCDAKGPRWASWNIGIFLCIRCAGIHRNLGVHISKVKSVNLDTWTPEQVVSLQQMGNSRARAVFEANLPDSFRRPQTDSALESFIRAKYESRKYIAEEWVQPPTPKVNWDKELDEEAERLRRKKKENKISTVNIPVPNKKIDSVVPQPIPKPNSSPKQSSRGTPPRNISRTSASADLLGLDTPTTDASNGDDVFSSFLSAQPLQTVTAQASPLAAPAAAVIATASSSTPPNKKRSEEEESFFNQTTAEAPSGLGGVGFGPGGKLTTDSILALYAKNPIVQPLHNNFHHQGVQSGFQGIPNFGHYQQQQPQPQQQILGTAHPQAQAQLQQPSYNNLAPNLGMNSNPFYQMSNVQQNLSGDLAAMKLTNQQNSTLSNHLWQ